MPDGIRQLRDSGKSLIDAVVVCAVLTLVGCVVLPALSKDRDDARIAQCADHLKQLAQAAHQYAADFEGKFFYNWYSKVAADGSYDEDATANWYDKERVGRYIKGWSTLEPARFVIQDEEVKLGIKGFTHGTFLCPSDEASPARSYHMNYWASGVDPAGKPAQGFRYGTLFDSSADKLNQLMLFTDVIGKLPTTDGWVTVGRFGMFGKPGERFGGPRSGAPRYFDDYLHAVVRRFKSAVATDLDYSRHGTNDKRWLAEGAVNIAYADAHVALKQHTDL